MLALLALPPSCPSRSALCIIIESYGLTLLEAHFVALLAVLSESHAAPLVDLKSDIEFMEDKVRCRISAVCGAVV
jgi:hypothetical protein